MHTTLDLIRHGEPVGHPYPLGAEMAAHFAQRGILSSNERDVLNADLLKPLDVGHPRGRRDSRCFPGEPTQTLVGLHSVLPVTLVYVRGSDLRLTQLS